MKKGGSASGMSNDENRLFDLLFLREKVQHSFNDPKWSEQKQDQKGQKQANNGCPFNAEIQPKHPSEEIDQTGPDQNMRSK